MGPAAILAEPGTDLRLFGKPEVQGHRRLGVALARGQNAEEANAPAAQVQVRLDEALGDR